MLFTKRQEPKALHLQSRRIATYWINVSFGRTLPLGQLRNYLAGGSMNNTYGGKEDALAVLNILINRVPNRN
jgi:hypothetical protein